MTGWLLPTRLSVLLAPPRLRSVTEIILSRIDVTDMFHLIVCLKYTSKYTSPLRRNNYIFVPACSGFTLPDGTVSMSVF